MEKQELSTKLSTIKCGKVRHNIYLRPRISQSLKNFAVENEFTISDAVDFILNEYLEIYGDLKKEKK